MKKNTIKKIRRFMAENNVQLCNVAEIYSGGGESIIGASLLQGNGYAPQWVHDEIRKLAGLPKSGVVWADTGWEVKWSMKIRGYGLEYGHTLKKGELVKQIKYHELTEAELDWLADELFGGYMYLPDFDMPYDDWDYDE